jgi:hypothetical protein
LFILLLSPEAVMSDWVRNEFGLAQQIRRIINAKQIDGAAGIVLHALLVASK